MAAPASTSQTLLGCTSLGSAGWLGLLSSRPQAVTDRTEVHVVTKASRPRDRETKGEAAERFTHRVVLSSGLPLPPLHPRRA